MLGFLFRSRNRQFVEAVLRISGVQRHTQEELTFIIKYVQRTKGNPCGKFVCSDCPFREPAFLCRLSASFLRKDLLTVLKRYYRLAPTDQEKYGNLPL